MNRVSVKDRKVSNRKQALREMCLKRVNQQRSLIMQRLRQCDSGEASKRMMSESFKDIIEDETMTDAEECEKVEGVLDEDELIDLFTEMEKELLREKGEMDSAQTDVIEAEEDLALAELALASQVEDYDSEGEQQTPCPVCKQNYLMCSHIEGELGAVMCCCGLVLRMTETCTSLSAVRQIIADALEHFSVKCKPTFEVSSQRGLFITCAHCELLVDVVL